MIIFNLSNTEEARDLGKTCDPSMIPKLQEARLVLIRFARQAQFEDKLGLAMDYACRGQFMREAIEAFEARCREELMRHDIEILEFGSQGVQDGSNS